MGGRQAWKLERGEARKATIARSSEQGYGFYACMHVCVHVCMHACVDVYVWGCIHA
jgi:hypothetical protein